MTGSGYGLLIAAFGVGAAMEPLALLRLVRQPRRARLVLRPFPLRGVVDLVLAVTTRLSVAAAGLVAYGVGTWTGAVTFGSLLQAETEDRLRGRVFAMMDVIRQVGRLLPLAVAGIVADLVDVWVLYVGGSVLLLMAAAYGAARRGPSRPHRRPDGARRRWSRPS